MKVILNFFCTLSLLAVGRTALGNQPMAVLPSDQAHVLFQLNANEFKCTRNCTTDVAKNLQQALTLLQSLHFQKSHSFSAEYSDLLLEPFHFVGTHISEIIVPVSDIAGLEANAFTDLSGRIQASQQFLANFSPLDVAATLVHEAAHNLHRDQHVTCEQGEWIYHNNKCDSEFSGKKTDGSFAFQAWFYMAAAKSGQLKDRNTAKSARTTAHILLRQRINKITHPSVNPTLEIFALNDQSELARYLVKPDRIKKRQIITKDPVTYLSTSAFGNAVIFGKSEGAFAFDNIKGLRRLADRYLPKDFNPKNTSSVYIPFLKNSGFVFFEDFSTHLLWVSGSEFKFEQFLKQNPFKAVAAYNFMNGGLVFVNAEGEVAVYREGALMPSTAFSSSARRWSYFIQGSNLNEAWGLQTNGQIAKFTRDKSAIQIRPLTALNQHIVKKFQIFKNTLYFSDTKENLYSYDLSIKDAKPTLLSAKITDFVLRWNVKFE